jgi:hypothetical protein
MDKIENLQQYEEAEKRVEELLPLVNDNTPTDDPNYIELVRLSNLVADYSDEHFSILKDFDEVLDARHGKVGTPEREQFRKEAEEYLNNDVPVEASYRGALQEINRLEKNLAYRDGENTTLLAEVKYLERELNAIKKKEYEKRHATYKAEITSLHQINVNYKLKIKEQEEEIFNLKEANFRLNKENEKLNLELLKKNCKEDV